MAVIAGSDTTVVPGVSEKMIEQYEHYGATTEKIVVESKIFFFFFFLEIKLNFIG